ncbi:MAG: hypothetical protein QGG53_12100, partial [Planctomycetota bacterium]|nr:hypothetical protein [Planctomycetota bacterium]
WRLTVGSPLAFAKQPLIASAEGPHTGQIINLRRAVSMDAIPCGGMIEFRMELAFGFGMEE